MSLVIEFRRHVWQQNEWKNISVFIPLNERCATWNTEEIREGIRGKIKDVYRIPRNSEFQDYEC